MPKVAKPIAAMTCDNCGAEFVPHRGNQAARFCSQDCYHTWTKGRGPVLALPALPALPGSANNAGLNLCRVRIPKRGGFAPGVALPPGKLGGPVLAVPCSPSLPDLRGVIHSPFRQCQPTFLLQ